MVDIVARGEAVRVRIRHEKPPLARRHGVERKIVVPGLETVGARLHPIVMKRHGIDRRPIGAIAVDEGRARAGEAGETLRQAICGLRRRHQRPLLDPHQAMESLLVLQGRKEVARPKPGRQLDRHDLKSGAVERGPQYVDGQPQRRVAADNNHLADAAGPRRATVGLVGCGYRGRGYTRLRHGRLSSMVRRH